MKRLIRAADSFNNTIYVTMYLHPVIYADFGQIEGAVSYSDGDRKYYTDINPSRVINGPLSEYGEELQPPIKDEYLGFIEDCLWLVKELGFTVINNNLSPESKKSEYAIVFGIDDEPCGTLVYDLRISDHPYDATFPEELKDLALYYLKVNRILDGDATKAGIDFQVEKVTVGSVRFDTWNKALNRLFIVLKKMRDQIKTRNRVRGVKASLPEVQ